MPIKIVLKFLQCYRENSKNITRVLIPVFLSFFLSLSLALPRNTTWQYIIFPWRLLCQFKPIEIYRTDQAMFHEGGDDCWLFMRVDAWDEDLAGLFSALWTGEYPADELSYRATGWLMLPYPGMTEPPAPNATGLDRAGGGVGFGVPVPWKEKPYAA